jgi:hypothetical protein
MRFLLLQGKKKVLINISFESGTGRAGRAVGPLRCRSCCFARAGRNVGKRTHAKSLES